MGVRAEGIAAAAAAVGYCAGLWLGSCDSFGVSERCSRWAAPLPACRFATRLRVRACCAGAELSVRGVGALFAEFLKCQDWS